ncbi:hypothetical protein HJFPF1_03043 [Paramyrothecium foliicola]|nr:hypothetical protein HJFPF1_03043 [Paramyrothecium foliicola]
MTHFGSLSYSPCWGANIQHAQNDARPLKVVIVGAGIGGLGAAIALRKAGHKVEIYEQSMLAREVGAAVHLAPNSNGIFRRWGLFAEDFGANLASRVKEFRSSGQLIKEMDLTVANAILKALAMSSADTFPGHPAQLHTSNRVTNIDPEAGTVVLENDVAVQADLVVGADGVYSHCGEAVSSDSPKPFTSGKAAFRFLIFTQSVRNDPETAHLVAKDSLCIWFGNDRRVVAYPCNNNETLNFACIHPDSESHATPSDEWKKSASLEQILHVYKDFDPSLLKLFQKVPLGELKVWQLLGMDKMPRWTREKLALLGDVAHPFTPCESAALATVLPLETTPAEVPERLRLYESIRASRAHKSKTTPAKRGRTGSTGSLILTAEVMAYTSYNFGHDDKMTIADVSFNTSRTFLETLLPNESFKFKSPATVCQARLSATIFNEAPWVGGRTYSTLGLYLEDIQYVSRDGHETDGGYLLVLFEDIVAAFSPGCDDIEVPRLRCVLDFSFDSGCYCLEGSWNGTSIVSISFSDLKEDTNIKRDKLLNDVGGVTLAYRYPPAVGIPAVADAEYPLLIQGDRNINVTRTLQPEIAMVKFDGAVDSSFPSTLHHTVSVMSMIPVFSIASAQVERRLSVDDDNDSGSMSHQLSSINLSSGDNDDHGVPSGDEPHTPIPETTSTPRLSAPEALSAEASEGEMVPPENTAATSTARPSSAQRRRDSDEGTESPSQSPGASPRRNAAPEGSSERHATSAPPDHPRNEGLDLQARSREDSLPPTPREDTVHQSPTNHGQESRRASEYTLPRWQPDVEVTYCPICHSQFNIFVRKHHCRKCGRVVCNACSPHRIIIPHQYIVRPPGSEIPLPQSLLIDGLGGGYFDVNGLSGGERVRLCNPCVPDPNTAPPQSPAPAQAPSPRSSHQRSRSSISSTHGPAPHSNRYSAVIPPSTGYDHYRYYAPRSRSITMAGGPSAHQGRNETYQATFDRIISGGASNSASTSYPTRISSLGSDASSSRQRVLPPVPQIAEEDECPICHRELPSRSLPNFEAVREAHINLCVQTHSTYGSPRGGGDDNAPLPPPRRTGMYAYSATEKDCIDDAECTICLEEFTPKDGTSPGVRNHEHRNHTQHAAASSVGSSARPNFNWEETTHVLAFGDSYTFVQGTNGHPGYSFIGNYQNSDNFSITPEELLTTQIVQNYKGTSAGGPNWVEFLTGCGLEPGLTLPSTCKVQLWDFAFAGANTAEEFLPLHHDYTTPFVNQTQQWLSWGDPVLGKDLDKDKTLVAIWIGINDINDAKNFSIDLNSFYDSIISAVFEQSIQPLYQAGYQNFLLINLPPLDRTPSNQKASRPLPSKEMVGWWNDNLERRAKQFARRHCHATVMVYDANSFLNGVLDNPSDYGIKNTTHACPGAANPDVLVNPGQYGCTPIDTYFWFDAGHISYLIHGWRQDHRRRNANDGDMSAREVDELKQQGAIEAAADPQSSVTAADAEREIVERSKNAGVAALSFDPNASIEQKRAQARAAIPPELQRPRRSKNVAIATDVDDGTGPDEDLPEPTTQGAIAAEKDDNGAVDSQDPDAKPLPYSRAGWSPKFAQPFESTLESESLLDHATWVEGKLPDTLYGDWYHNTAVIIFACVFSWVVAVLGGGLGWIILITAICGTYYRTSLRRVRRNFRDDITRELALKKLETDHESLEWINAFMLKFWPIYQPVLAETIVNSVDQVLSSATPAFLDSLKLKTFTLGSKPPRMEHVKTYPKTEEDIVMMDWAFSFTPNDTADLTEKQIKNKINPKVVLEIRIGKAMISKGLDVIVEDMSFSGLMRLKIKLQIPFPHVERVEMSFLKRPTIDYVCKPLGGESFGFDINFIPGLESFILEQIHGNLAPMMYAPNVFPIEVAKMLAGTPVDQAVGVLAVTLHGAQGLKNTDNFGGTVDPYASITFNRRQELARTKTIEDNANPRWNETHYLIVTSFNDSLDIMIFDKNDFRKSKELGVASFRLENLEEVQVHENERIEVIHNGKARGLVNCDLRFFPVLEPTKLPDGKEEPPPESNQGILRFNVERAKDLDGSKSMVGQLNPFATLFLNGKEVHQTKKLKRTNNPVWDNGSKEILITDRKKAKLGVTIKDDRDLAGDQVLGKYQIKLSEMLECMEQGKDWFQLAGAHTGRVKMTAQWKPVAISGVSGTGGYITPIGVMRFHFQKATDLRNFEAFGKSDPYVRVLVSGIEKTRTVTFRNDLNPAWDEVLYVPIHSARDRLTLEVMDTEKVGKDRSLGLVEVFAGDYVQQEENGEYQVNDKKTVHDEGLRLHGKGIAKGTLTYTAAFYPCLNVADPEEEEEDKKKEAAAEDSEKSEPDTRSSLDKSSQAGKFKASFDKNRNGEPTSPTSPKSPTSTVGGGSTAGRPSTEEPSGPPKLHLTPEQLLKYESGMLIFRLLEAEMPESNTHLEVYVDDLAYPSYISTTAHSRAHKFEEIGDCVIRELDFSRLTLKARKKGDDQDDTIASLTGNTLETLKQCLNNPTTLKLKGENGNGGWVKVSLKYIPIKMDLDPSESINNMGTLRVDVLDANDLPSADRNGKSDPYCQFKLNGEEIYKTKVQKKTLQPVWNEFFEVTVPSRTAATFMVDVFDYDFADKPDHLGSAHINLESLDPFRASESKYILDGKSGTLRLRLLFRPDYVTRTRQGTSTFGGTFSAPGRIVTGVAGVPLKGGVAVAGVVGHGVGKGATFLRRGLFGRKDTESATNGSTIPEVPEVPIITTNGDSSGKSAGHRGTESPKERPVTSNGVPNSNHVRARSFGAASMNSAMPPGAPGGTATFTVVGASGFPPSSDLYVSITQISPNNKAVGKTKHHKTSTGQWNFDETFRFACTPDAQFKVEARGEHLFGSDDELGEHVYFVDESGSGEPKEISVGSGTVVIKSTFQSAESNLLPDSPKSHTRRSFLSKREGRSRETTPNP